MNATTELARSLADINTNAYLEHTITTTTQEPASIAGHIAQAKSRMPWEILQQDSHVQPVARTQHVARPTPQREARRSRTDERIQFADDWEISRARSRKSTRPTLPAPTPLSATPPTVARTVAKNPTPPPASPIVPKRTPTKTTPAAPPPPPPAPQIKKQNVGTCVICYEESISYCLQPCNHICTCKNCTLSLTNGTKECPVCRGPIEKAFEVFIQSVADDDL